MSSSSLLKFQIGPVQDFIAQARSTRDLWSGSYLLSWLVAAGIEKAGRLLDNTNNQSAFNAAREAFIYPALDGQPLLAQRFGVAAKQPDQLSLIETCDILTPNMPNIFVAKLKRDEKQAEEIARKIERSIRAEWKRIARACWGVAFDDGILKNNSKKAFFRQVDHFLSITWQVIPLGSDDSKYATAYKDLSARLDGVRQCRNFAAWREGQWHRNKGAMTEKDTLTGKEEAIIGGKDWFQGMSDETSHWKSGKNDKYWPILIREKHKNDYLGAITLIKRTWHWHFLHNKKKLLSLHTKEETPGAKTQFPFPSTRHIARHMPWSNSEDEGEDEKEKNDRLDGYFAVLAFDGDRIGTWVRGEYFSDKQNEDENRNTLTTEKHREISRKLGNFALKCVRPIVDSCDGRLIYAGGDDVLALLPPDTALDCARFLRMAYRDDFSFTDDLRKLAKRLIARRKPDDKSKPDDYSPWRNIAASENGLFPDIEELKSFMPGSINGYDKEEEKEVRPEASVGIAIAHFMNPLQDTKCAAKAAETRAKKMLAHGGLGRAAISVTLLKRSGEHIEWGCRWESGGLALYDLLADARIKGMLTSRFPYRVVEILSAYQGNSDHDIPDFDAKSIIEMEFAHVLRQQSTPALTSGEALKITSALSRFLLELSKLKDGKKDKITSKTTSQYMLRSVIGLCQTLAFTLPKQGGDEDSQEINDDERLSSTSPEV
jgi:CRISPR-associated protein Cmr2